MKTYNTPASWGLRTAKRAGLVLGFTLVEMAIVLVVIGLVLSGGLLAVAPILQSSKVSDSKAKLDRIEQALVLHVIRFGCLPCPATAGADSSVPANNAGQALGAAVYTSGCSAAVCGNAQGIVPWVNLGLSEADITDGFGYRIDYAITSAAASPGNLQATTGMQRTPPSTYPAGSLVVNNTGGTQISATAAYVLISHGPDHSLGFVAGIGTQSVDPNGSANQTANSDGSPFVQDDLNGKSGGSHFDDIVRWRTAPMIVQLCGSNACGNPA